MSVTFDEIVKFAQSNDERVNLTLIDVTQIEFEERVKLRCYYCPKYDTKWTCPPRIPNLDYKKMVNEYENAAIISLGLEYSNEREFEDARNKSSLQLHRLLLKIESYLFEHNNVTYNTFIGGSCKLCKNGCSPDKCKNPGLSRIPLEAIGVNIVKTLKKYNINVVFPPSGTIYRYGLLLW